MGCDYYCVVVEFYVGFFYITVFCVVSVCITGFVLCHYLGVAKRFRKALRCINRFLHDILHDIYCSGKQYCGFRIWIVNTRLFQPPTTTRMISSAVVKQITLFTS